MNRSSLPAGLSTLKKWKDEKDTLHFDLAYQRHQGMWGQVQKSMLVWSILADSYIPPIVLVKADEDKIDEKGKSMSVYSVLDGLQRLSNLFDFLDNKYQLHGSTPDVDIDGDTYELAGKYFEDLPQDIQNLINSYKFSIQVIANATEDELTMLFTNINSGKELSVIQKAKPKLGVALCNYFAKITSSTLFSQGLNLTANQALREEDLAIALQSLILMNENYDDWKSVSVAECLKYAGYLRGSMTSQMQQDFEDVVDYMSVFSSKTKYLRKNNVAVILKLAEQMLLEGIEAEAYKAFLNEFFSTDNEDYKEHSGAGNVKRVNVEARYDILKCECYKYFKLGDAENSELDDEQSSTEEDTPAMGSFINEPTEEAADTEDMDTEGDDAEEVADEAGENSGIFVESE